MPSANLIRLQFLGTFDVTFKPADNGQLVDEATIGTLDPRIADYYLNVGLVVSSAKTHRQIPRADLVLTNAFEIPISQCLFMGRWSAVPFVVTFREGFQTISRCSL